MGLFFIGCMVGMIIGMLLMCLLSINIYHDQNTIGEQINENSNNIR